MNEAGLAFYATPGPMTRLPESVTLAAVPADLDEMRRAVQGLLLHRDWAPLYGVTGDEIRLHEEHALDQTEDGRVGAKPERQGEHNDRG